MKRLLSALALTFSFSSMAQNLSSTIPHPYYAEDNTSNTKVMNIDAPFLALQLRIDMIRRAKKSIEAEYFIFNTDLAGKLMAREFVAAAKRGVKVRVLVDFLVERYRGTPHWELGWPPFLP